MKRERRKAEKQRASSAYKWRNFLLGFMAIDHLAADGTRTQGDQAFQN